MGANQLGATLFAALGLVAASAASVHALLYKRRPQSAFGWIAVCFTLPLLGPLLYYLFGINRVKTRARKLLTAYPEPGCPLEYLGTPPPPLAPLARLGAAVTGWPLSAGNRVETFVDAAETFDAMIAAIDSAQVRVSFATYIFDGGPVGQRFAAALVAATKRGVDVRVLLDGVGEWYSLPRVSGLLASTPVRLARFLPPRLWPPAVSINLRNHRKCLVIDGKEAFTGGINIRDRYLAERGEVEVEEVAAAAVRRVLEGDETLPAVADRADDSGVGRHGFDRGGVLDTAGDDGRVGRRSGHEAGVGARPEIRLVVEGVPDRQAISDRLDMSDVFVLVDDPIAGVGREGEGTRLLG